MLKTRGLPFWSWTVPPEAWKVESMRANLILVLVWAALVRAGASSEPTPMMRLHS